MELDATSRLNRKAERVAICQTWNISSGKTGSGPAW